MWRRKWREIAGGGAMLAGFVWGALIGFYLIPEKFELGPVFLLLGGFVLMISTPRPSPKRTA